MTVRSPRRSNRYPRLRPPPASSTARSTTALPSHWTRQRTLRRGSTDRGRIMKIVRYKDKRGEWRWRLMAKNGKIVADSGEGYKRKASLNKTLHAIAAAYARNQLEDAPT